MSNTRDPMRLRQGLNPLLTTSLGVYQNHVSTPLSATSMASGHPFSARTPSSAIQPYNPQEWIGSPVVGPERTHQFPIPDAQVTPPPPPPYSPPRNQQPVGQSFEPPSANTSAARIPPTNVHRPSPEPATTSFPPPPGANGRGASRDRRFGLPSLGRRKDHEQATSPPEPHPPVSLSRPTIHIQIPTQIQRTDSASSQNQPPSARRASSMSAVESTPTSARSRSTSQSRWGPGMPLPPPPPGPPPPPSQSRSQSLQSGNRQSDPAAPIISPPTRRPPPSGVAALGPVPPTPANWVDHDVQANPERRNRSPGLTLDTASVDSSQHTAESNSSGANNTSTTPQSGSLARARAVRHDKTIIQRRTESRTRGGSRNSMDFAASGVSLSEIVVPATTTLARRLQVSKTTPRSGDSRVFDSPSSTDHDSRHSTPRPLGSAQTPYTGASTPPFSPHPTKATPSAATEGSPSSVPKALPTPPPQTRSASSSRSRYSMPASGTEAVGLASASSLATVTKHIVVTQTADQFCRSTIERFQAFAMRESQVASDADRVRLFADFIVSESRIRRERYSSAIGAMGSEIFDLTRDLFRPMTHRRESNGSQSEWTPQSSEPTRSHRGSMTSNFRPDYQSNSAPPSANLPQSPTGSAPQNPIGNTYMPSLSPILSLSMSGQDETSSRGRPSSRWWEVESNGGGPAGPRFERSKRESKYMGVPKEAREALQWTDTPRSGTYGDMEEQPPGSASEYPPEKTGWHDAENTATTPQALRSSGNSTISGSVPNTPNPAAVDVSRLVTLPPPYPRHHPAVNNNHPDLTSIRVSVRAISDLAEVEATKQRFQVSSAKAREEAAKAAQERKQSLRANLQTEINQGNMTYAEAGAIEADSAESEKEKTKELQRRDFEQFQSQVVMPLNELLTARISTATALFNDLAGRLFDAADNAADMPQEEGDDKPELLEKLTLLKWIFEAREILHRAIYDVLSDRNDRYRDVVLTPYRLSGNEEKVRSAEAFFAQDAARRQCDFAKEVLARTGEFRAVVEENVLRGVEVQLGAFWDIAPALRRLLDEIPADLGGFAVQIPASEYDENPSYHAHPLQYLFSLLLHAEKSTYQLIESQTNLLCLLHEVKEAATHAKARVVGAETEDADGRPVEPEERERRAAAVRTEEEERLTQDLKERVRVVQDQWTSALGEGIQGAKERIGEWLLQTGGWDESLEDGDVGGV